MVKYAGDTEERTYNTQPPNPEEALVKTYRRWRMKNSSDQIPKDFQLAAKWWLEHQEPVKENEQPVATNDHKGNQHWTTPFIDRVVSAFRVFLRFSEPEKAFIIHHIDLGVAYRGDDLKYYKLVIEQAAIYAKDPKAYQDGAREHLP